MATTFVGVEIGGVRGRPRHAAVVLQRRRSGVVLCHWASSIVTDEDLLDYLASVAGANGVIAVHGGESDTAGEILQRVWRVMDYRMLYALAPRHRTRALVRVDPSEVCRAFSADRQPPLMGVLESVRALVPSVDFQSLTRCMNGISPQKRSHTQFQATLHAALSAYAALWCWWHGPAGYDVLGANSDTYRLAPRLMDFEPDIDISKF